MTFQLEDKVAIVTGGSEGIGFATAARLATHGARVVIAARRADVLEAAARRIGEAGGKVLPVVADVTRSEDIERLVRTTVEKLGQLDILVNNAGTGNANPFEAVSDVTWEADLDLKLHGAIRTIRAALPHLKQSRAGRIINVTTPAGKHPGAHSLPTSVSRAAGIALTKALSKDLAQYRILVNTVCVGVLKSAQHERRAKALGVELERHYHDMGKDVPLGRVGEADEAANVIVFLASGLASYVTGTSINVDGGTSGAV
jgi:NAD(P)-dependent dehydrogenase (short-subunit alcohol dehydrogenase family)